MTVTSGFWGTTTSTVGEVNKSSCYGSEAIPARGRQCCSVESSTIWRNHLPQTLQTPPTYMRLPASRSHRSGRPEAAKKMPEISKPLSELFKGEGSPMLDIESYIHRPECERKDKVKKGKSQGKVKRPLNAFMLYRKVYQKHIKKHYAINNHRLVSQLCGAS
jgi:hypothetical protein